MKKAWLKDWPWETVVAINAALCKEKKGLHKPTSDGHSPAKRNDGSSGEPGGMTAQIVCFFIQNSPF
jgi:hypothetical protein